MRFTDLFMSVYKSKNYKNINVNSHGLCGTAVTCEVLATPIFFDVTSIFKDTVSFSPVMNLFFQALYQNYYSMTIFYLSLFTRVANLLHFLPSLLSLLELLQYFTIFQFAPFSHLML